MKPRLLYVFDPLCGWCYAAQPLIRATYERFADRVDIEFHPGLLFFPPHPVDRAFRRHIIDADLRIGALTGLPFGEPYLERLRSDASVILNSLPAAAAVVALSELAPACQMAMLEALQRAHYADGLDIAETNVLVRLARQLGLADDDFSLAWRRALQVLPARAAKARSVLHAAGGQGFPTFVLEIGGRFIRIDHADAYARPALLTERLDSLLNTYARARLNGPIEAARRMLGSAAHADPHP